MDIQPMIRGVVKIRSYFGCEVDVLRYNDLKIGCSIQCHPTNNITMDSFKNIIIYLK